ncbi:MAG: nucleotidyltransferase substrate binding protein [Xanthomonadaceae bacterium]|nr:nucleotidyltransferase substrate binding protein [Xanthomonadaceae bacterium]MDP2185411.1 nucleotidyltransferase substrate binding protein [Xanthomonadales bacterium]MDZ4116823.1 nucleotidyltransferase substrate binding protein [Xanthomonadaceae bacterium]MDZ4379208.1 nucleotidyltransferase substrate binding protein [Xanthomonadaceae bacterium]
MKLDLTSFEKALASLDKALLRSTAAPTDEELRDACIQRFEFTFELSWKMLKRRLERDLPNAVEVDSMSYRSLIRSGAEQGLIEVDVVPRWFVYRDKRNLTSHAYDAAKAAVVYQSLGGFARDARLLLQSLQARGAADA